MGRSSALRWISILMIRSRRKEFSARPLGMDEIFLGDRICLTLRAAEMCTIKTTAAVAAELAYLVF